MFVGDILRSVSGSFPSLLDPDPSSAPHSNVVLRLSHPGSEVEASLGSWNVGIMSLLEKCQYPTRQKGEGTYHRETAHSNES